MAIVLKDRVKVLATTTGTGTFTLGSAVNGYQDFSVIGDGNSTYYTIAAQATSDWEVGIGTYTASGTLLSRDTILESSNGGAAVDFPAGTKDVFVTYPAERSVYLDSAGAYPVQNTFNTLNAANAVLTAGTISTTPASGTDIVNKTYVDTIASSGIHFHTPVRVETPASEGSLNATYNNGTSGVGATLTNAGTQLALVIDGVTLSVADRVLVYNQTNATQNGVYVVSDTGSVSTNWVLTRATDADSYGVSGPDTLSEGSTFFVTSGNTGAGETYTCNTIGTITFGTTNITFAQISSAQIYSAGTGLTLTNTTFSITNTGTAGTYGSASAVPVFVTNAQGQVTSVTNTTIAIASGAVSGLAASATTDTTNASNITSGTLGTGRISGSYTGITGVGTLAAGTWNGSTIAANYGGTGYSSYTVGDLLYSDTSSTLAKLADVAVGNALISGGVAAAPSWGKIGLSTHVSGTLPVANGGTGITSLGAGVATFLGTPSSANLAAAVTDETGSGSLVFATSPTLVTPALGTPSSGTLTNATGLPIVAGTTGTLSVARGGTGATTLTANNVLLGNGTSALQVVAPSTSGNVLTSNGTTWTSAAPPPSAGTVTAVATGTIANGATVVLNSDGTVSAVTGSTETVGSPTLFSDLITVTGITGTSQSAYDSTTNKVIVAFRNVGNSNRGTVVVGTVSGTTISFGSPANFTTYDPINTAICYDAAQNKILVGYRDQNPFSQVRVGTISGTSVTFGSEVRFSFGNPTSNAINLIYHPVAQKVVMTAYDGNTSNTIVRVGTISGTSISFGTEATLKDYGAQYISTCYDSVNQKIVFTYSVSGVGTFARVGTVSGTSISFGTELNILGLGNVVTYVSCAYDSNAQKVLLAYAAPSTNFGTAKVGTVSGTSISFGSDYTFDSASTAWISVAYMQTAKQTVIAYRDQGNSNYGTLTTATISGTAITFSTAIVYESAAVLGNTVVYDASRDKSVVFYQDNGNSNYGTAVVYQPNSTNLNEESYLGISSASYTNGQTATIQIAGSVDDAQTGLTAGQAYYVQRAGTLATTPATPAVFAGTARSATQLVIGAPTSLSQLVPVPASGNVLVSDGSTWTTQSGGSWVLISSVSANSSATIDITSGFNTTYTTYAVVVTGVIPSTNNTNLQFLTQRSGTFASSDLAVHSYNGTTSVTGNRPGDITTQSLPNDVTYGGGSFIFYITDPSNTTSYKKIYGNGSYTTNGLSETYVIFGGSQSNTAALTGVRFQMATGNIASGTFKLYGIRG